jgi:hypothetical protein
MKSPGRVTHRKGQGSAARGWLRFGGVIFAGVLTAVMLRSFSGSRSVMSASAGVNTMSVVPGAKIATVTNVRPAASKPVITAEPEASPRSREWVERLRQPLSAGQLTMETALAWEDVRAEMVASGAEAVPAIREFLARNVDSDWGPGARRVLGYDSARVAMFDALLRIGGSEAEAALAATLAEAKAPREIALLARNLEQLAPGQYGELAVEAARQALAVAGANTTQDVAPLFEVLQRFGGAIIAPDLEGAASQWHYYATLALAQLPDAAGVSALVRLAEPENPESRPAADPAVRMLAGLAIQHQEARLAFLELARNERVPASTWAQLGPILAGAQMQFSGGVFAADSRLDHAAGPQHVHLNFGNQNFWTGLPAVAVSAEQWEKHLEWLDQLAAVATTPTAKAAVQEAWKVIVGRLRPLTASVN